ncbi:MAG: putative phage tail protein [Selenomonadaceae bacterium]|nr:putative phage tail protein [Selenomonadaceae bacterium]
MNFQMLRTSPVDLSRYLPDFLFKDKAFTDILASCSTEHERQRLFLQELAKQFFVETATWGLADWERILGLTPRPEYDYGERRRRILLRLQSRQTSTLDFMARLISRYLDGDPGYVEEHNKEYFFRVMMEGALIDKAGLIEALETYKPAHLAYDFRFLLVGDTLREDFGASGYGEHDDGIGMHLSLGKLHDVYPYESYDYLPQHGDDGLYHNGEHARGGAEGPTIDWLSIGMRLHFADNLQDIQPLRGDDFPRGAGIRHGPYNVYPFDFGEHCALRVSLPEESVPEATEGAHESLTLRLGDDLQDFAPHHGDGRPHDGTTTRNEVYPADAGDGCAVIHYTPYRGWRSRDGILARGAVTYRGDAAEDLLARRARRNGLFARGGEAVRGRA